MNRSHALIRSKDSSSSSQSLVLIACVLAIAALYLGRQVFIPLALALILSFLLTPLVMALEKLRLGRVPAVLMVTILSFAFIGTVIWGAAGPLVEILSELPSYKENLDIKIQALHATNGGSLSKATATVEALNKELSAMPRDVRARAQNKATARPLPVQVTAPQSSLVEELRELLGPLTGPIETAAIVIIFTLFMLVKREDLRNRLIRLAGRGQLSLMTQALDDAAQRLSRYLMLQFLVNASYGLLFGLALHFIGVPHARLFGVLCAILRFVPYIGTLIGAAFPIAMSLAVFPGWGHAGLTFGAFVILELTVSNILEPLLYGAHTGISSLAILVAAVFWAMLWGPVGLVLSTPLTVCLMVLGRHVPQLKFLEIVLGDEPVLPAEQHFYQRLLALDQEEARTIAETYLKDHPVELLYETVLIPALKLAEQDYNTGDVDDNTRRFIFRTTKDLVEELGENFEESDLAGSTDADRHDEVRPRITGTSTAEIACVPAREGADELATKMLAQVLSRAGHRVHEFSTASIENVASELSPEASRIVILSAIPPFSVNQARLLCRRLRKSISDVEIVVGLWNFEGGATAAQERLKAGCPTVVITTLSDALKQIQQIIDPAAAEVAEAQEVRAELEA